MNIDPAAEFLLTLQWPNLFERRDARTDHLLRCKGCEAEVNLWDAKRHHRAHVRAQERAKAEAVARGRARGLRAARAARRSQAPVQEAAPIVEAPPVVETVEAIGATTLF